ncbi:hypothetical protein ACFX2J_046980 [Malus domestica]
MTVKYALEQKQRERVHASSPQPVEGSDLLARSYYLKLPSKDPVFVQTNLLSVHLSMALVLAYLAIVIFKACVTKTLKRD